MPSDRYIAYYCTTAGRKGCKRQGVELQRTAVMSFLNSQHGVLIERHTESRSSRKSRPALTEALAACRAHNAALVIADPGQLQEDCGFMAELTQAGVECWAVETAASDWPQAKPLLAWAGGGDLGRGVRH